MEDPQKVIVSDDALCKFDYNCYKYLSVEYVNPDTLTKYRANFQIDLEDFADGLVTYECNGGKCRRIVDPSYDRWCTSCHGEPGGYGGEMSLLEFLEIFSSTQPSLNFSIFREFVTEFEVTEITKISNAECLENIKRLEEEVLLLKNKIQTLKQSLDPAE